MTQKTRALFKTDKDTALLDNTDELITPAVHRGELDHVIDSAVTLSDEWGYALINPAPVRAATTTDGTLATAFANGQTIDGLTLATGERILLKNQSDPSENGIYLVASSGAPVRSSDFNSVASLTPAVRLGARVYVSEGTANAKKTFTLTAPTGTITINTSNLTFEELVSINSGERSSAATLTISQLTTVYAGSAASTWTLPIGSDAIKWVRYYFDSIGTGTVTITRASTNTINGASATTFTMKPGQRGLRGYWDGVNWVIG
jgi:hypothetical protein